VTETTRKRNVATYTADAVALLVYFVDSLPDGADRVFAEAEAGESIIQAPSTALAEVIYAVSRDKDVRGIQLVGSPEEAQQSLLVNGPVSSAPVGEEELAEYARVVEEFNIHDGLVVASHHARETEAVITSDGVIQDAGVATIWA
jgi:predicted nucleic acid-binding protein